MGLLHGLEENCERCGGAGGTRIVVTTGLADGQVRIHLACECGPNQLACRVPPEGPRLATARRRLQPLGGRIELSLTGVEIRLPAWAPPVGAS